MGKTDGIAWESPNAPSVIEMETEGDILHDDADRTRCAAKLAESLVGLSLDEAEAAITGIGEGCAAYHFVKDGNDYRFRIQKTDIQGFDVVNFTVGEGVVTKLRLGSEWPEPTD